MTCPGDNTTRPWRRVGTAVAAAFVLAAAGCGGDDGATPTTTTPPEEAPAPVSEPTGPLDAETIEVGTEVFYSGFRVEVEEASIVEVDEDLPQDPTVEISLRVENLTADALRLPTDELELAWDDGTASTFGGGDEVLAGASARTVLEFTVDEDFAFDDAVLSFGSPARIQAIVALVDPDSAVAAAPIPLEAPAGAVADQGLEVEITGLTLTAWGGQFSVEQADLDQPFLEVTLDATLLSDAGFGGGANMSGNSFRLILPDGTQIGPQTSPILTIQEGATERSLFVSFQLSDVLFDIGALPTDEFVLRVELDRGGEGVVQIPFSLVPADAADEQASTDDGDGTDADPVDAEGNSGP
jgi:hypothetical protein